MNRVLAVTVPAAPDVDLYQMRDYVKESLEQGVLVVGAGVQWDLLELPAGVEQIPGRSWRQTALWRSGRASV